MMKADFEKGGLWLNKTRGHRVHGIHRSGKAFTLRTEMIYDKLVTWEMTSQAFYASVTPNYAAQYENLFTDNVR